jgi:hypothetical protein
VPLAGQLDQRLALPALNPVQLTQVGNGVAVRLDPFRLFYLIKLARTPVELELNLGPAGFIAVTRRIARAIFR